MGLKQDFYLQSLPKKSTSERRSWELMNITQKTPLSFRFILIIYDKKMNNVIHLAQLYGYRTLRVLPSSQQEASEIKSKSHLNQ